MKKKGGLAQPLEFEQNQDSKQWEIVARLDGDVFGCNVMNTPCLGRSTVEDKYVRTDVQVSFVVGEDDGVERTKEIPIYFRIYSGRFQEYLALQCKNLKVKAPQVLRTTADGAGKMTYSVASTVAGGMKGTVRRPAGGNP